MIYPRVRSVNFTSAQKNLQICSNATKKINKALENYTIPQKTINCISVTFGHNYSKCMLYRVAFITGVEKNNR